MTGTTSLVVAVVVSAALASPLAAEPPKDIRAFCETVKDRTACLQIEPAAKARVERMRTSFHGPAMHAFTACERITSTWGGMEACVMRGGPRSIGGTWERRGASSAPPDARQPVQPMPQDVRPAPQAPAVAVPPVAPELPKVQVWGPVAPSVPPAPTAPPIATTPTSLTPAPAVENTARAKTITPQEADEMAKRVSKQSGGAKCETKVYGGGGLRALRDCVRARRAGH
jgi:hypothetical protein